MIFYLVEFHDQNRKSEIRHTTSKRRSELAHTMSQRGIFSLGIGYETKEELIQKQGILPEPCKCCGNVVRTNFTEIGPILKEKGICFSCNFWEKQNESQGRKRIIVNGTKYADGGNIAQPIRHRMIEHKFQGHGGRVFKIEMEDGETFETNNLWCQGDIPEHFRDRLKDNAKFI